MATLAENHSTMARKPPTTLSNTYAAELGPYEKTYDCQVIAYVTHTGGGNDSTAMMRLLCDGGAAGEAYDRSFDTTDLKVPYSFRLSRGSSVGMAIVTENHLATVGAPGFSLAWKEPMD